MNQTEAEYAELLEAQRLAGEILSWAFESVKLRLADRTFYTPDFQVMRADLSIEFHEVKGHWEDDARVKIKVASEVWWMYRFLAVRPKRKRDGGGWEIEEFGG